MFFKQIMFFEQIIFFQVVTHAHRTWRGFTGSDAVILELYYGNLTHFFVSCRPRRSQGRPRTFDVAFTHSAFLSLRHRVAATLGPCSDRVEISAQ